MKKAVLNTFSMNKNTMLIRAFVFMISVIIECQSEFEALKVEYYEKLIQKGIQDAASYQGRTDNSDFFQNVTDNTIHDYGRFDFIVVGGGSSGSVVSSRLTEVSKWKVLLLEAGGDEDDFSQIPGMDMYLSDTEKNWGYITTPQAHGCFGMVNRQCLYPRGKVLGGSGGINELVYARGNRKNFDSWEELGNPGWSYKNVLKYFKKSENSQIDGDEGYHGFGGPLNSAYFVPPSPFLEVFESAFEEIGYKKLDYNGAHQIGVSRVQINIRNGKRASGGNSFVRPAMNRVNFNVTLRALVTKILINQFSRAHGVLFMKNGKTYKATASKEVIISGGSINTPQLLMLSGVGPRLELQKHNITLIRDLPVGQYMRDQIAFTELRFRTNYSEEAQPLQRLVEDYLKGRGVLTSASYLSSIGYINLKNSKSSLPNLELLFAPPIGSQLAVESSKNVYQTEKLARDSYNPLTDFIILPFFLYPKSVGKLTLKSSSARDFPNIDTGIFSVEDDVEQFYQGIQFAINVTKTKPFRKYNATVYLYLEACRNYTFNSKGFWICAIRHLAFAAYHMSSTAKMGPPNDPKSVVNHELKVYGVENLRVADCSIMPDTVAGHTSAAAFMIGEKAADMIKKYWHSSQNKAMVYYTDE